MAVSEEECSSVKSGSSSSSPPSRYYLSKCVLRGSAVLQVLYANLRSPSSNDVVFGKETSIELVVIDEDGNVQTVCDQPVFGIIKDLAVLLWNEKFRACCPQLPSRQEPALDSSKYTAADVRITDQKLRVCDICGAFLSVYDSDRRLADHFGGKLHLGYMQIREKLAELQEERNKSRKTDRLDDRRSKERSRDRDREPSRDRERGESHERGRDNDRRSRDRDRHHDRDRGYDRDRDRDSSRSYDSRSRRRSRSRERSRDYDRHRRHDRY